MGATSTRRRACDSCYKRKIQCDTASPGAQCGWCLHHKLPCTYDRPIGRKVSERSKFKSKSQDSLALAKRLEHIEARIDYLRSATGNDRRPGAEPRQPDNSHLTTLTPESTTPSSRNDFEDDCNSPGHISCAGRTFGVLCSPNGFPYFTPQCERWIHTKTGEWPRFEPYSSHESIFPSLVHPSVRNSVIMELPSRSTLETMLNVFFGHPFSRCFPFVDRILFQETMATAYNVPETGATRTHVSAQACIFSFAAIVSMKFPEVLSIESIDGDGCMQYTESILSTISGVANIDTLQSVLMLALYKAHCGHVAAASMYHAMACRLVFALGGQIYLPRHSKAGELTLEERKHRQARLMFWLCFIFDKETALRSAQPPLMSDEYCDLTLPDDYENLLFAERFRGYDPYEEPIPCLISDLRLVIIKSKVVRELYSAAAFKKTDAELLQTIRELDEELERWRSTVPPQFAPSLSIRKDVQLVEHLEQSCNMLQVELYLTYHHLLSIIHWASGRCVVGRKSCDDDTSFGLQSSLDLSVEASRSTMIFLGVASHKLSGEAFWLFTFYPISAFMSLFFNLIRKPNSEYAELDLELLSSASDTIRDMPKRLSSADEMVFLAKIDGFVEEVTRLARSAVSKRPRKEIVSEF